MLRSFAMSATRRVQVDVGNPWSLNVVMMRVRFFFFFLLLGPLISHRAVAWAFKFVPPDAWHLRVVLLGYAHAQMPQCNAFLCLAGSIISEFGSDPGYIYTVHTTSSWQCAL
jgi:hypothetical protein